MRWLLDVVWSNICQTVLRGPKHLAAKDGWAEKQQIQHMHQQPSPIRPPPIHVADSSATSPPNWSGGGGGGGGSGGGGGGGVESLYNNNNMLEALEDPTDRARRPSRLGMTSSGGGGGDGGGGSSRGVSWSDAARGGGDNRYGNADFDDRGTPVDGAMRPLLPQPQPSPGSLHAGLSRLGSAGCQ